MGNNYTRYLEMELRELSAKHIELAINTRSKEAKMISVGQMLQRVDELKDELADYYQRCREEFRDIHRAEMEVRQDIGEFQEELFALAENEEDWH